MDNGFYEDLFNHFRSVAYKVAPRVGSDENLCRVIFHEKVLFPKKVVDMEALLLEYIKKFLLEIIY